VQTVGQLATLRPDCPNRRPHRHDASGRSGVAADRLRRADRRTPRAEHLPSSARAGWDAQGREEGSGPRTGQAHPGRVPEGHGDDLTDRMTDERFAKISEAFAHSKGCGLMSRHLAGELLAEVGRLRLLEDALALHSEVDVAAASDIVAERA